MATKKVKRGERLACVPCGREVTVDCCGASSRTIWCCDKPMAKATSSPAKKTGTKK